ncbi:DUF2274 domain-containing protein [Caulobacter sp. UNC279MFTsu5.1]|uniref:DUF2274 domain-containing protein n=1 Tax=Caulobacter sp. UNC279MFTsu5.1 TaxID=1502775 RepID=UPI0008E4ADC9|nr:DUF2274 domain-containing protein [Caulobacter sp. UNC279MFTsu5.1]SFI53525.1 hypothetical protein SAMN02799626_00062 [Caulobacter sp. UNC279MFTsu5.1]
MNRLKITGIEDDTPVKVTSEVPAAVHRDLIDYGKAMGEGGGKVVEPAKLLPEMARLFMASDRGFVRGRKSRRP